MILGRFWQKLKQVLTRKTFRSPEPYREPKAHGNGLKPERTMNTKFQKMVSWCRAYNQRNGYIVPQKSPESIYLSAHRRRIH